LVQLDKLGIIDKTQKEEKEENYKCFLSKFNGFDCQMFCKAFDREKAGR